MEEAIGYFVWIAFLGASFAFLESRFPANPGQRQIRDGIYTDVTYWVFLYTAGRFFTNLLIIGIVLVATGVLPIGLDASIGDGLKAPTDFMARFPLALQIVLALLIFDFLDYWCHRLQHGVPRLWLVHAVHHSATEVDWLTTERKHPFEDALTAMIAFTPTFALGFSPAAILGFYLIGVPFTMYLHSNIRWSWPPLRYVITAPAFHRWHHSSEVAALDKNFGLLVPWWDMLFGTMYYPKGILPTAFGTYHDAVPPRFAEQLVYPLLKNPPQKEPMPIMPVSGVVTGEV